MRNTFHKTIGDFDRIEVDAHNSSEWMTLTMHVGMEVKTVAMTFRSDEAVRDLHYAISRYIDQLPSTKT